MLEWAWKGRGNLRVGVANFIGVCERPKRYAR